VFYAHHYNTMYFIFCHLKNYTKSSP